jgi:hypothetical protein
MILFIRIDEIDPVIDLLERRQDLRRRRHDILESRPPPVAEGAEAIVRHRAIFEMGAVW